MNFQWKPKRYLITLLKVIGWISLSIFALLVILSLSIQIPFVQNKITQKAISFLKKKIGTEVRLGHISLSIPKKIVLTGLYVEDQSKDTLLYAGELAINTDLWALTKHTIQLNDVELSDFNSSISRSKRDSSFNFDYIIKAFAGDTTAVVDTTQAPWRFALENIKLEDIHFHFNDGLEGNEMELQLGSLDLALKEFDLENSVIKVDAIDIEKVKIKVDQNKLAPDTVVLSPDSSNQRSADFTIGVEDINLKDIQASYNHRSTGQTIHLNLGKLTLEVDDINLRKRQIHVNTFALHNTFISYQQMAGYSSPREKKRDTLKSNASDPPWHVTLQELDLSNNNVQYNNFDKPLQPGAFDPNHLWVTRLNTQAEDLEWEGNNMRGELTNLSFQDRSGFSITSFRSGFALTDKSLRVNDFEFNSPNSKIALDGQANFSSLATVSKTYPEITTKLSIQQSVIGWRDVQYFLTLPDTLPIKVPSKATIELDTRVEGALKNLKVHHFTLQTLSKTSINTHGTIQVLPKDLFLNLELEKFYTTKNDITSVLADTLIPPSLRLPEWINVKGHFKGTFDSPDITSLITSNLGTIEVEANLKLNEATNSSRYKAAIRLEKFQAGKLLKKEESIGPITMAASVEGSGLKMEELDTRIDMQIFSFIYQGYNYKDFKLKGTIKKYFFSGTAELRDENLNMKLAGDLDYNENIPNYHFIFELKNADFKALNLSERPLKARGTLDIDLATADFKVINGKLDIRKVAIFNGQEMYAVDSLLFASIDQQGQSEISIRSDIIDGNFKGTFNLYSLPEVIRRHFNNYFSLHDIAYAKPVPPQNFKFDLKIKNTDLITEILVPELDPFIPGEIVGEFDSRAAKLDLSVNLAKIRYAGIGTDSITFDVTSNAKALKYTLAFRKILMDTMRIEALRLQGSVENDSILTKLIILDSLQKNKYVLGGAFYSLEKVFQFRFLENEVIMNYAPWTAPPDNALQFTSKGIQATNFSITNINESISLKTNNNQDSTVSIVFKDLNLQNITRLIEGTTPLDGLANGDLNMMVAQKGAFNSRLRIDDLHILSQPWGNLSLALGRTSDGPLNVDVRLEGEYTELKAAGYYTADSVSPQVNFVANISKLDLASVEPLTMGQLKNTKGQLTGEVKIIGDAKSPEINGALTFKNAFFTPSLVNSEFSLENETITFTGEEIIIKDFELKDSKNNTAKLEGDIKTSMFKNFDLNLALTANNFQLLNSTAEDNELFYGNVSVTTSAKIKGNFTQPVVTMNIRLGDESNFTYVVPQSEKGVLEQKGIVRWVDRDAKKDPFLASINPKDTIKSTFKGITLSANIELNEKETFNIIIDPATGDKLSVKGNSTLTLDIDPTGDMVLSGRYEIVEGSYDFSFYKLVKRNFKIEKGSTIIWSGSPIDATMDIRAIYEVETSPIELLSNQDDDSQVNNTYKQRLPFQVYLQIKGELMAPEISFQLDMPETKRNALNGEPYRRIQDINTRESELNKQVFALLILKRFISENPLDNRAGSDVASTARRSVSKLLSEQLNRMSQNVKGVELSFDVKSYEDYSSGSAEGQTEVQLGLSKSLLDDRLVVKVSGNVEVEGETSNQNSVSDYIGDLALEYKLTEDGRFRITGFRNSNYDMISGELIETGVGLIYIKDYNTLRELFKANAKEN